MTTTDEEAKREANRAKQARWYAAHGKERLAERKRVEKALTILCQRHPLEFQAERAAIEHTDGSWRVKWNAARRALRGRYPNEFDKILKTIPADGR